MITEAARTNWIMALAAKAKAASGVLAQRTTAEKNAALQCIAQKLNEREGEILAANQADVEAAQGLVETGEMSDAMFQRLKLDETKLTNVIEGIHQVIRLEDPVGKITLATELDAGLRLYRVNCPIGVIGVIFESRPDALVQIAALCLKSGNSVILKGGREAERTNHVLAEAIREAIEEASFPGDSIALLDNREDVNALLQAEGLVDLIIPRGSNSLVRYIQQNTNIPVLGHADGICHLYVDRAADFEKALKLTIDAKAQYPAVCNAIETLLIHKEIANNFLPRVIEALQQAKVEVRCAPSEIETYHLEDVKEATEADWATEYGDYIISVKTVASIDEAIAHINLYGSRHTETIVTEDGAAFEKFFAEVDSAGVFWNASTRFADGYRYGFGAEVGISTYKLHPRGPVGLEGLVTYKYKLIGDGHLVATYSGKEAKPFTHKPL